MGAILEIQLSAFSNNRIVPNTQNIAAIMPKLKELSGIEFLPNIFNSQKIDITSGAVESIPNLSFISSNNFGQVICGENRIDCSLNYSGKQQNNAEKGFDVVSQMLQFIMEYNSVYANRLALNVTCYSNVSGNSIFEKEVMHVVPFYQNKEIKEWSSRTNAVGKMFIKGVEEDLNVITEYTRTVEQISKEIRIVCHADINTVIEKKDFRFKHDGVSEFEKNAKDIFTEIQMDLEKLVTDEK